MPGRISIWAPTNLVVFTRSTVITSDRRACRSIHRVEASAPRAIQRFCCHIQSSKRLLPPLLHHDIRLIYHQERESSPNGTACTLEPTRPRVSTPTSSGDLDNRQHNWAHCSLLLVSGGSRRLNSCSPRFHTRRNPATLSPDEQTLHMSAAVIPLERSSTTSSSRLSFSGSLTHSSSTFTSASCPPSPGQLKLNCLENSYNSLKARPSSREAILSNPGNAFETAHSIACQSTDSPHAAAAVSLAKCRSSSECHTRSDSTSFVIPHGALSFKSKEFQCECDPETRMTPAQAICDTHVVKSEVPFCGRTLMEETTGRTSRYIEVS